MMSTTTTTKHFNYEDSDCLEAKGRKKICHTNTNYKNDGGATVISDKADLKATNDTRVKNRNIIIKESIHEEYIKILKIYAPINSFNT